MEAGLGIGVKLAVEKARFPVAGAIGLVVGGLLASALSCATADFTPARVVDAGRGRGWDDDGGADEDAGAGEGADVGARDAGPRLVMIEPGDRAAAVLAAVQGAKASVHVTMYLLTSTPFIDALVAQKKAGHEVKVVLNASFPEGGNSNQRAYDALTAAGVSVVWAPSTFVYTHEKCVIVDGVEAWIMTMNLTASSPTANREFLIRDDAAEDVGEAEAIFEADFAGSAAQVSGPLLVAPVNASERLLALAAGAKATIDVEGETFSDNDTTQALVNAKTRGVAVRVVLSTASPTPAQQSAVATLKGAGIPVVMVATPYIHAKALVADGARAYVGSENFTYNSLHSNRELGVILDAAGEVAKVGGTISGDFAQGTAL